MKQKKNSLKLLTNNEEYIKYVQSYISNGVDITSAVKNLCAYYSIEYSDSLRRQFSKKLESLGLTNNTTKEVPLEQSNEYKEALTRELPTSKYHIVTWAQAETPIHKQFWENIQSYARKLGAEIIVQAGRYKSPTSLSADKKVKAEEKGKTIWAKELQPYLYASRLKLTSKLEALCDVKVQPTAILPISGLNGFTADNSCILPHPKVQLQSLPILDGYNHKLVLSTGAVTLHNYTDTKAGKKGEFHHQFGFVIVEKEDDSEVFHLRQVQADEDGNFYDLWYCVCEGKVYDTRHASEFKSEFPYSIVWGDLHVANRCEESVKLAVNLSKELEVENVILHDLFDGESINHHEEKDPFRLLEKEEEGADDLAGEISYTLGVLKDYTETLPHATFHNIASNHNDFLDRWLKNVDWRKVKNKKMYLQLANIVASGNVKQGVINYLINQDLPDVQTYGYGDSLRIKNWELALHGDLGINGSRGGIQQFKNLSTKTITGHSHSPQRQDGSIVVGTLTKLRLGYNKGLSSWVKGVVVIYPNGKATNVHFIGNKYTTFK